MSEGLQGILKSLRRMREGIEEAILAIERVESDATSTPPSWTDPATSKADTPPSNRRSEAQKKRWASKKAAEASAPTRKRGMTPAGRKRLAEAMKKRWAVKRAAVKKVGRETKAA